MANHSSGRRWASTSTRSLGGCALAVASVAAMAVAMGALPRARAQGVNPACADLVSFFNEGQDSEDLSATVEMKVVPWQIDPPLGDYEEHFKDVNGAMTNYWSYSTLKASANGDLTQTYVDAGGRSIQCVWTCVGVQEKPNEDVVVKTVSIQGGSLQNGNDIAYFTCPTTENPHTQPLVPGDSCGGSGVQFDIEFHGFKDQVRGSWMYQVQYTSEGPNGFIYCPGTGAGGTENIKYQVHGYSKPFLPELSSEGWYYKGGTIIIGACLGVFVAGWLLLFKHTCKNLPELPDEDGSGSESGSGSGSDDSSTDSSSGSDTDSDGEGAK